MNSGVGGLVDMKIAVFSQAGRVSTHKAGETASLSHSGDIQVTPAVKTRDNANARMPKH